MSFLKELQERRSHLKPASTILTIPNGEKFVENRLNSEKNVKINEMCYGFVVDSKPDHIPACITDFLYLGSQDAVNLENIIEFRFTHILSVGIEMPLFEDRAFRIRNVKNQFIACLDLPTTNLYDGIIQAANDFIEEARENKGCILVHCNAGVSRSASVVIAYLMHRLGMNFTSTYKLVKSRRECIQPNSGFMQQLSSLRVD